MMKKLFLVLRATSQCIQEYVKLFNKILGKVPENIIIAKSFNAQQWISACDSYFTNYSTLLLDADAITVPSFVLDPIDSKYKKFLVV